MPLLSHYPYPPQAITIWIFSQIGRQSLILEIRRLRAPLPPGPVECFPGGTFLEHHCRACYGDQQLLPSNPSDTSILLTGISTAHPMSGQTCMHMHAHTRLHAHTHTF